MCYGICVMCAVYCKINPYSIGIIFVASALIALFAIQADLLYIITMILTPRFNQLVVLLQQHRRSQLLGLLLHVYQAGFRWDKTLLEEYLLVLTRGLVIVCLYPVMG